MKIYVASSWRNVYYPEVVNRLREAGFEVYDFRNPPSGDEGFHWHNVSERWLEWTPEEYRDNLTHPYKLFDGVACSLDEVVQLTANS